jgi:hypothetical protein
VVTLQLVCTQHLAASVAAEVQVVNLQQTVVTDGLAEVVDILAEVQVAMAVKVMVNMVAVEEVITLELF